MSSNDLKTSFDRIQNEIMKLEANEIYLGEGPASLAKKIESIILQGSPPEFLLRIRREFFSFGPLEEAMEDETITEILVNGPESIWVERQGKLQLLDDRFLSPITFRNFLERICQKTQKQLTVEHPSVDTDFEQFRLAMIGKEITGGAAHLTMRRHPKNPWNFTKLIEAGWCDQQQFLQIKEMIETHKSFLIVGSTGSGKTSILNSCLALMPENERVVVIEDTAEIALPNTASMRLLTREDPNGLLPKIGQSDLVKRALRLRPDRLAMGEIRFEEAKDFLMALSTGHSGGFGTLHASDPQQALIRLEMLVQMGAPQWNLSAIRRLIQLGLHYILITERVGSGKRRLAGLYRLGSLEDSGFLAERIC